MKTLKEKIKVMQAALDGKEIEISVDSYRRGGLIEWRPADNGVYFNWERNDYRIKPEPMEFWVNVYDDGSALHESESNARECRRPMCIKTIKVREVIE
jgi:hypothetical protein